LGSLAGLLLWGAEAVGVCGAEAGGATPRPHPHSRNSPTFPGSALRLGHK